MDTIKKKQFLRRLIELYQTINVSRKNDLKWFKTFLYFPPITSRFRKLFDFVCKFGGFHVIDYSVVL